MNQAVADRERDRQMSRHNTVSPLMACNCVADLVIICLVVTFMVVWLRWWSGSDRAFHAMGQISVQQRHGNERVKENE